MYFPLSRAENDRFNVTFWNSSTSVGILVALTAKHWERTRQPQDCSNKYNYSGYYQTRLQYAVHWPGQTNFALTC